MVDHRIPINIITGFLGVGKTTAILNLLANRPENEIWAVVVNEFGKVPIDQAAMRAIGEDGMQIAEVAGGCICCTAEVDMQVAMQRLLEETSPNRILIEPTGLGHPDRIREIILEGSFSDSVQPSASLCLVDPRQCANPRIGNFLTYWEQVKMADVVVVNKTDLADAATITACREKLIQKFGNSFQIVETQQGQISPEWLDAPIPIVEDGSANKAQREHHHHASEPVVKLLEGNASRMESTGLDFYACGWKFDPDIRFSFDKLSKVLDSAVDESHRIKGVIHTDRGWYVYNAVGSESSWVPVAPSDDSRLEHIRPTPSPDWKEYELQLIACLE